MSIILKSTPTQYEKMMDQLVPPLFELLNELDSLEQEIYARDRKMEEEKIALNIPRHIIHPKWPELREEFKTRYGAIIDKRASEKLKSYGYANSFGKPSRYFYLKSGEFSAEFTMRKENMASIIVHYKKSSEMKHKFVLRLIDGVWLIAEKYYAFEDEKTWHTDSI
ncbi:MAG: hypothetical protein K2O35_05615 [Clostridia bacterium]|nr:hypothetical protein [Clostridia bacterium]